MHFFVGYVDHIEDKSPFYKIGNEISQEKYNELMSCFKICGIHHSISQIKNIVIENGIDFKMYMKKDNLTRLKEQKMSFDKMVLLANKCVLNYATSIKTYIDMETRLLDKYKTSKEKKEFHSLCSKFYDTTVEYRFWVNLRNYVTHYDFPYSSICDSIENACEIICLRSHLLEFDNWKQSKKDIVSMESEIDLPTLVDDMSAMILALYINFYTFFIDEIIKSINKVDLFLKEQKVKEPVIFKLVDKRNISSANMSILPIMDLKSIFKILKSNPNIKIKQI